MNKITLIFKDDFQTWNDSFLIEKERINKLINKEIYHVGSTSIKGLLALPIIDILVLVEPKEIDRIEQVLCSNGYKKNKDNFENNEFHVFIESSKQKLLIKDYLLRHDFYIKQLNDIKQNFNQKDDVINYEKAKEEFFAKINKLIVLEKSHKKGRLARLIDGEDVDSYSNSSASNDGLTICDKNIDGA